MNRITVAIPVYNTIDYLEECFVSLVNQTDHNFRVVIIDDGSTDGSSELCDAFVSLVEWVEVWHFDNSGPLLARCHALEHIDDGYVVFLDADDYFREDAIECIRYAIENGNAPDIIAYCSQRTDKGYNDRGNSLNSDGNGSPVVDFWKIDDARKWVLAGNSNSVWGKAIKRACFGKCNCKSFGRLMHGEDLIQLLEVFGNAHSFCHLDSALYFYRQNCGNATSSYRNSQFSDIQVVVRELIRCGVQWTGQPFYSIVGSLIQYLSLFGLLETTKMPKKDRQIERNLIRGEMLNLREMAPSSVKALKAHNAFMVTAICSGRFSIASMVSRGVRNLKNLL